MHPDPPVLVLAPTERDAQYTRTILGGEAIAHEVFRSLEDLIAAIDGSTGAIVLNEEALSSKRFHALADVLQSQLSWSELPVVLLTQRGADSPRVRDSVAALGNVTLVERPVRVSAFLSVLHSALRARRRQHQVRNQLGEVAELNQRLERLAFYDTLTGLPNRDLLRERLTEEMERVRRHGGACAVLFLDFDDFKVLNDSLGHDIGDEALRVVAERLRASLRTGDTAARLGGDEFVVVLTGLRAPEDAASAARKVLRRVAEPFVLNEHELRLSTSLGIAPYTGGDESIDDVLKHADLAMYHAKGKGKRTFEFFTDALQRQAMQRLTLERELRAALDGEGLILDYQPRVRLADGKLVAVEALVRWDHPTRGRLGPDAFVPLAEEVGLVWELGLQVLERACRQAREWQLSERRTVRVSVNLSVRQLQHSGLVEAVAGVLSHTGLPAHLLELEITESATMVRVENFLPTLDGLKALGVRLAIDDFGTGYSSLEYLQRLPIDAIKIARGFVGDHDGSMVFRHNQAIVRAIVALGNNLGIELVGEGIETESQRQFLMQLGCHEGQGFLFGHPSPASSVTARLEPAAHERSA